MTETRWIDDLSSALGGVPASAWCVNLARRPDRWEEFASGCPVIESIRHFPAYDGERLCVPTEVKLPAGAWGCMLSHLAIWREAICRGYHLHDGVVVVFEDDAVFAPDFASRSIEAMRSLPHGWGMLYLGGQHTHTSERRPVEISPGIDQAYSVNRTHAYAIRGKAIATAYRDLADPVLAMQQRHMHIDHRLEILHREGRIGVFSTRPWLCGQGAGTSDIQRQSRPDGERWWQPDGRPDHRRPVAR